MFRNVPCSGLYRRPIVCGSELVVGALENSTSINHSSVASSSDKCALSKSGNSAEDDAFSKGGGML